MYGDDWDARSPHGDWPEHWTDWTEHVSVAYTLEGSNPNLYKLPERPEDANTWTVRHALEDGPMSMRFFMDEGRWHYYGRYGKKPMPGGQREALSNAELMFHG